MKALGGRGLVKSKVWRFFLAPRSQSGLPTSETRAHYAMDEEMGRMLRTQDHTYKLKRNQFTEFAEALGRANPKKEGGGGKAAAGGGGGGGGGKAKAGK